MKAQPTTKELIAMLYERLPEIFDRKATVQEPVAWADMGTRDIDNDVGLSWTPGHFHTTPLYATPPAAQQPWVGLADEEMETLIHRFGGDPWTLLDEVTARLEKRNT
jgi:hypothetical protein